MANTSGKCIYTRQVGGITERRRHEQDSSIEGGLPGYGLAFTVCKKRLSCLPCLGLPPGSGTEETPALVIDQSSLSAVDG